MVGFISHRVEILEEFEAEAKKYRAIILEEPENRQLYDFFDGEITLDDFIMNIDTTLPVFSRKYVELLRKLYESGVTILQVEPYLENLGKIYRAIESGEFDEIIRDKEVSRVRETERKATQAMIEYQEAFLKKDFDSIVESTINFTKADAERFRFRDYLRAQYIKKIIHEKDLSTDILIEAGQIHFLLPEYLKEIMPDARVSSMNLIERVAERINLKLVENPGNKLTRKYIRGEKVDRDEERLLAARGLLYISLTRKDEMLPTDEIPFPHLEDEKKVIEYVNSLSYEECKEKFENYWMTSERK